ncbi:MAG TPA: superoxide dismutase family protein [Anaeromyxobacteraceae bacterium]
MRPVLAAAVLCLSLPAGALAAGAASARAALKDAKGQQVGTATLTGTEGGVKLVVEVNGLPPGQHGIHVHGAGKCEGPEFKSAGGHFNPSHKKHGLESAEGHHAGDLPNLTVGADGTGTFSATLDGATLGQGSSSLLNPEGASIVIHAGPDDGKTDPAGNSGARIACGVIEKA